MFQSNSLHNVFLVAAPVALTGCLVVMLLRERPLRGRAGAHAAPASGDGEAAAPEKLARERAGAVRPQA